MTSMARTARSSQSIPLEQRRKVREFAVPVSVGAIGRTRRHMYGPKGYGGRYEV